MQETQLVFIKRVQKHLNNRIGVCSSIIMQMGSLLLEGGGRVNLPETSKLT